MTIMFVTTSNLYMWGVAILCLKRLWTLMNIVKRNALFSNVYSCNNVVCLLGKYNDTCKHSIILCFVGCNLLFIQYCNQESTLNNDVIPVIWKQHKKKMTQHTRR
jgi:hypothetical protein